MDSILINHLSSFLTVHCTLDTADLSSMQWTFIKYEPSIQPCSA